MYDVRRAGGCAGAATLKNRQVLACHGRNTRDHGTHGAPEHRQVVLVIRKPSSARTRRTKRRHSARYERSIPIQVGVDTSKNSSRSRLPRTSCFIAFFDGQEDVMKRALQRSGASSARGLTFVYKPVNPTRKSRRNRGADFVR